MSSNQNQSVNSLRIHSSYSEQPCLGQNMFKTLLSSFVWVKAFHDKEKIKKWENIKISCDWGFSALVLEADLAVIISLRHGLSPEREFGDRGCFSLGDLVKLGDVIGIEFVSSVLASEFNECFAHFWAFLRTLFNNYELRLNGEGYLKTRTQNMPFSKAIPLLNERASSIQSPLCFLPI